MTEKDKIFNYTKNRFTSEGFYKISMDEIAAELRISKKTIYKYFPSKDMLVHEIIKDEIKSMHIIIDEIINKDADVITKFVEIMEYYIARLSKTSDKWMREIQLHLPDLWSEVDKFKIKKVAKGHFLLNIDENLIFYFAFFVTPLNVARSSSEDAIT